MPLICFGARLSLRENEKAPTPLSVGAFFAGGKFLLLKLHFDHGLVLLVAAWGIERDVGRLVV